MPKTVRQWAMRKLTQSAQSIDWALSHLNDIEDRYREQHPEISDEVLDIMGIVQATQGLIEKLRAVF